MQVKVCEWHGNYVECKSKNFSSFMFLLHDHLVASWRDISDSQLLDEISWLEIRSFIVKIKLDKKTRELKDIPP